MNKELEELAEQFIIGYTPLTEQEKTLYAHIDYIEHQLALLDIRRGRLLRVWKAISKKLMGQKNDRQEDQERETQLRD